jgi:hypothetical protein
MSNNENEVKKGFGGELLKLFLILAAIAAFFVVIKLFVA